MTLKHVWTNSMSFKDPSKNGRFERVLTREELYVRDIRTGKSLSLVCFLTFDGASQACHPNTTQIEAYKDIDIGPVSQRSWIVIAISGSWSIIKSNLLPTQDNT